MRPARPHDQTDRGARDRAVYLDASRCRSLDNGDHVSVARRRWAGSAMKAETSVASLISHDLLGATVPTSPDHALQFRCLDAVLAVFRQMLHLGRGHMLLVRQEDDDDHGDEAAGGDKQKAAGEAACRILDPAHGIGPDETGDVAERVDHGDAGGGRRARQEGGRQRPEDRQDREHAEASDRQARHLGDRIVEHRRQADEGAGHGERDGGVALALEFLVGAPAPPDHADEADGIGNGGDHADLQIAQVAEVLDDLRQPEADAVIGRDRTEIDHGKRQHARVRQRFANGEVRGSDTLPLLFLEFYPPRRYREATASDSITAATASPRIATWRGEDTSAYIGAAAWT